MPSNITKQPQFQTQKFFNGGSGDSVIGGVLTGVPAGIPGASQFDQTRPGDRIVLGAADAFAVSSITIGTLYAGIYMYVTTKTGSVIAPTIQKLAFWDPAKFQVAATATATDNLYQVSPDEPAAGAGHTGPIAGVFINTMVAGNSWWIQIAGKATMLYGAATTSQFGGTATFAANQGVYAGGYGQTTGSGLVSPIAGTTFVTTNAGIDAFLISYLGIAETNPGASSAVIVDMPFLLNRL